MQGSVSLRVSTLTGPGDPIEFAMSGNFQPRLGVAVKIEHLKAPTEDGHWLYLGVCDGTSIRTIYYGDHRDFAGPYEIPADICAKFADPRKTFLTDNRFYQYSKFFSIKE